MKTVRDLLRDADPTKHEPALEADRARVRHAVMEAPFRGTERPFLRTRVIAAAAIGAAALVAAVAGSRVWLGSATLQAAAVRFEARLAETTQTFGLVPARIAGSDQTIYLHPDAVVTNEDIASARVVPGGGPSQFHVGVVFTPAGAEKMRAATAAHIGRPLALMIDGQVVMAPTVRSAVSSDALLTGNFTRVEADRIAAGMLVR